MKKNNSTLVVFDFCETLVSIQTANRFIDFISENSNTGFSKVITKLELLLTSLRVFAVINLLAPKWNLSKKINLLKVRGIPLRGFESIVLKYVQEVINPKINESLIKELKWYVANDYVVCIVSGGYKHYLEVFCKEYGVNFLLANDFEVKKQKFTGFMNGKDCMFDEKVVQLEKYIDSNNLSFKKKIVYSDSPTDMPLFKWADEQFAISYNKSQKWALDNNFKEIILPRNVK